jgi:hypothetical protein
MNESIISVGILYKDLIVSLPPPARHHSVLHPLVAIVDEIIGPREQGFVTSTGRWVDRTEGASIAIAAGQIEALNWPPHLYSEDLW